MNRFRWACLMAICFAVVSMGGSPSTQPVGWRMGGDGVYPNTDPPLAWSPNDNVVWKTRLSAASNASPVWIAGRSLLVVLNEPDEIVAVRASTGDVVWKATTGDVTAKRVGAHKANGWATPTPVSDGSRVFAVFGSGVVAGYSLDGQRLWARVVQQPSHRWGHSASPALAGGHLIVHLADLVALDPATGEERWRASSKVRWGSPVVAQIAGADVVVTPTGDVFRADDGTQLATGIGKLQYATPVIHDGVAYFIEKRATAVKLPQTLEGSFESLWETRLQGSRHYASAVVHRGLVYAISREEKFSILDAKSGELLVARDLDLGSGTNSAYPSLAVAGDKLFVSSEDGVTAVLELGRGAVELSRSSVEGFRSSPVFVGDRMYLRTFEHLYCFGSNGGGG